MGPHAQQENQTNPRFDPQYKDLYDSMRMRYLRGHQGLASLYREEKWILLVEESATPTEEDLELFYEEVFRAFLREKRVEEPPDKQWGYNGPAPSIKPEMVDYLQTMKDAGLVYLVGKDPVPKPHPALVLRRTRKPDPPSEFLAPLAPKDLHQIKPFWWVQQERAIMAETVKPSPLAPIKGLEVDPR